MERGNGLKDQIKLILFCILDSLKNWCIIINMKNTERFQKIRRNTFLEHPAKVFEPKRGKGSSYRRKQEVWENWHEIQDILQEQMRTGNIYD